MEAQPQNATGTREAKPKHKRRLRPETPLEWVEHGARTVGDGVYHVFRRWPTLGIGLAAGSGLALSMTVGAGELGLAAAAGYGSYLVLKKHEPPSKALEDIAKLEI